MSLRSALRLTAVALLIGLSAGCGSGDGKGGPTPNAGEGNKGGGGLKRIVFMTNGDDPFWDALLQGLNEGEKQYKLAEAGLITREPQPREPHATPEPLHRAAPARPTRAHDRPRDRASPAPSRRLAR